MIFFLKIVPNWVHFGQGEDCQVNHGTVQKSALFPQPGNEKRLKWSNITYGNKWSFTFKTKLCVFQVTKI